MEDIEIKLIAGMSGLFLVAVILTFILPSWDITVSWMPNLLRR